MSAPTKKMEEKVKRKLLAKNGGKGFKKLVAENVGKVQEMRD